MAAFLNRIASLLSVLGSWFRGPIKEEEKDAAA
jgi:hypothetical protein